MSWNYPLDAHEIADLLLEWQPGMNPQGAVDALMHALEQYSIRLEGSEESGLLRCLRLLTEACEERIRSI